MCTPNGYDIRLLQFIYYMVQIAWHKFKYSMIGRDFCAAAAGLKWDVGLTGGETRARENRFGERARS